MQVERKERAAGPDPVPQVPGSRQGAPGGQRADDRAGRRRGRWARARWGGAHTQNPQQPEQRERKDQKGGAQLDRQSPRDPGHDPHEMTRVEGDPPSSEGANGHGGVGGHGEIDVLARRHVVDGGDPRHHQRRGGRPAA